MRPTAGPARPWARYGLVLLLLASSPATHADTPQRFSTTIDGTTFQSDDEGITYLMPTKTSLNLISMSKGASSYPPPSTPVDRLSFTCKNFDGKPRTYGSKDMGSHGCMVSLERRPNGKSATPVQSEYRLADGGDNLIEITAVNGKLIEGRFRLDMVELTTKAKIKIKDGSFKAEDRQR